MSGGASIRALPEAGPEESAEKKGSRLRRLNRYYKDEEREERLRKEAEEEEEEKKKKKSDRPIPPTPVIGPY